ncbi:MAG: hypothetical protein HC769_30095 [Cyanobacteria bacterium CRU_2_1]|nr:hypothetical protein [Cyanobacteria bacterium CRU_2_1]
MLEAFLEALLRELRQTDQFALEENPAIAAFESVTKAFYQLLSQDEWSWILKLLEAMEYQSSYERQYLLQLSGQSDSETALFPEVVRERQSEMAFFTLLQEQGRTFHALLKMLEHQDSGIRLRAARILEHFGSPLPLAVLWQLHYQQPDKGLWESIFAIQSRCKFYNYELWQEAEAIQNSKLEMQNGKQGAVPQQSPGAIYVNGVLQIVEQNYGNVIGKQSPEQQ